MCRRATIEGAAAPAGYGDLCGLSSVVNFPCDGLRLINPGVTSISAGQQIRVPACTH